MRKALIYGAFFTACGVGIGAAEAAYVIKLKNGNEYVTTRYWREGSQVLFDTHGGIFGIEHAFVSKIEKTDQLIRVATVSNRDPSEKPQTNSDTDPTKEKDKEPTPKKEKAADDPIVGEFNRLKEKAKDVDGMLTTEIRELLNQITTFKNKLAKDSKLFVEYGREFNDLHELGDIVETALRARTQ